MLKPNYIEAKRQEIRKEIEFFQCMMELSYAQERIKHLEALDRAYLKELGKALNRKEEDYE